jgi:hypothetical protein
MPDDVPPHPFVIAMRSAMLALTSGAGRHP